MSACNHITGVIWGEQDWSDTELARADGDVPFNNKFKFCPICGADLLPGETGDFLP